MIVTRFHLMTEEELLTGFLQRSGKAIAVQAYPGILIDWIDAAEIGKYDLIHYRNMPKRSYSLPRGLSPEDVIEILAFEAGEWEAIEIARFWRKITA